jgi:catechol 2,3-dioxygenase-like lactoylglutathione lyase family enzyme
MAIVGIESLLYGVDDVGMCARFFEDFGLRTVSTLPGGAEFEVDEGSRVVLRSIAEPLLPHSSIIGTGVREVVWGIDSAASLERLSADLRRDREVRRDQDGTAHFVTDCGLPMALRTFEKKPVVCAPDLPNAPGVVNRLNTHRKWRRRARPRSIQHVVFTVVDFENTYKFFRDRLGFRISDLQQGYGAYLRADGAINHHNLLLLNAALPFPGFDGKPRFHHANFGVEDVDEIMIGANHMERRGWPKSVLGLGRHRIDSALFYYLPCPTGGEAEYGADADYVDDSWVPRYWEEPLFGYLTFVHNLPPFFQDPPAWKFRYFEPDQSSGSPTGHSV